MKSCPIRRPLGYRHRLQRRSRPRSGRRRGSRRRQTRHGTSTWPRRTGGSHQGRNLGIPRVFGIGKPDQRRGDDADHHHGDNIWHMRPRDRSGVVCPHRRHSYGASQSCTSGCASVTVTGGLWDVFCRQQVQKRRQIQRRVNEHLPLLKNIGLVDHDGGMGCYSRSYFCSDGTKPRLPRL